jgi:hypothetical protein
MNLEAKISEREQHGDTYEKYCRRCFISAIKPREFQDWLKYELAVTTRRGPHPTLDYHQQFQAG